MFTIQAPTLKGEIKKARASNYTWQRVISEFIDNSNDVLIKSEQSQKVIQIKLNLDTNDTLHSICISDNFIEGIKDHNIWSWTYERNREKEDCGEFGTGFKSASMTEDIMDPWMGTGEILGEYSADSLILNPFARYYMNDFFVHGGLNIVTGKSESNYNNNNLISYQKIESKTSTYGIMIAAGYSLKWGKHFVFEPMIGLRTSTGTQKQKITDVQNVVTENEYNLPSTTDIGVSLGISFILGNN